MIQRWLIKLDSIGNIQIYHFKFKNIDKMFLKDELESMIESYLMKYVDSNCNWSISSRKPIIDRVKQVIEGKYLEEVKL